MGLWYTKHTFLYDRFLYFLLVDKPSLCLFFSFSLLLSLSLAILFSRPFYGRNVLYVLYVGGEKYLAESIKIESPSKITNNVDVMTTITFGFS